MLPITTLKRVKLDHPDAASTAVRHLGVYLDENLSFKRHAEIILAKLSRAVYMINRVKHFLPKKALKAIYYSLFHCHITYCPTILNCIPNPLLEKMVRLQKKAIRLVNGSPYCAHTEPIFIELQILPIKSIIERSTLLFMHSIFHEYAPLSYHGHWSKQNEREIGYELRNGDDFILPFARTEALKKLPLFSFAKIWNNGDENKYIRNRFTYTQALNQFFQPTNT